MLNRRNNHAMTTYDPFREMDNFERHFFEDPFGVFFSNDSQSAFKTDITDEGDAYRLEADLPGFDKKDIVEISEKINTYETSIQPFEDCCTIFVAKHPVTKPSLNVIHNDEKKLSEKIDELMQKAIDTVEVIHIEA
mgnify:CR=1 FL=1